MEISRQHLLECGLDREHVDRVYRALAPKCSQFRALSNPPSSLYTYSVGMNELLVDLLETDRGGSRHRRLLASHLWRVYIALIETVNATGYQTAFSQLESQYRDDLLAVVSKSTLQFHQTLNCLEQSRKETAGVRELLDRERNAVLQLIERVGRLEVNLFTTNHRAECDRRHYEVVASQLQGVRNRLAASRCRVFLDRAQIRRLTAQLRISKVELHDLGQCLATIETERNDLKSRILLSEKQIQNLSEKHSKQSQQFQDLLLRYGHVTDECRAISQKHEQTESELNREAKSNRDLRHRLHQLQTAFEESACRFDEVNNRLLTVSTMLSERISQHDRNSALITALKADIGSLSLQNLVHTSRISDLESELERLQRQSFDQQSALAEASNSNVLIMEQFRDCQALKVNVEQSLSETQETLAATQLELEASVNETRRERSRVQDLKASLAHASEQINESIATLHTTRRIKDAKISDLEQELAAMQKVIDEQRSEIISGENVVSSLKAELRTLKATLESSQTEIRIYLASINEQKRDRDLLQQLIEAQKESIVNLEQRLHVAAGELQKRDRSESHYLQSYADLKHQIGQFELRLRTERNYQHEIACKSPINLKRRHSAGKIRPYRTVVVRSRSLPRLSSNSNRTNGTDESLSSQNGSLMNIMVRACQEMQLRLEKQANQLAHFEAEIAKRDRDARISERKPLNLSSITGAIVSDNYSSRAGIETYSDLVDATLPKEKIPFSSSDQDAVASSNQSSPEAHTEALIETDNFSLFEAQPSLLSMHRLSSMEKDMEELDKLVASGGELNDLQLPKAQASTETGPIVQSDFPSNRISLSRERTKMSARETLREWSNVPSSVDLPERLPTTRRQTSSEIKMVLPTESLLPQSGGQVSSSLEETLRTLSTQRSRRGNASQSDRASGGRIQSESYISAVPSVQSSWSILREAERRTAQEQRRSSLEKLSALRQKSLK